MTKAIFVGRQTELEQFRQVIGTTSKLERLLLRPGRQLKKPRLFLPHGIGGIGKTSLSQRCLAIQLDPNLAQAYSNRGITHANLKDYAAALADYNQAIHLDPNLATAYYNRGNTHANLKDYAAALADYNQAIHLDPNDNTPVYNTACAYALLLDVEQACHWLRRAIIMNGEYISMAQEDSDFDGIRDQPTFQALLANPPTA